MTGFLLWMGAQWAAFDAEHGHRPNRTRPPQSTPSSPHGWSVRMTDADRAHRYRASKGATPAGATPGPPPPAAARPPTAGTLATGKPQCAASSPPNAQAQADYQAKRKKP